MLIISDFQKMNRLEKIAITKHGKDRMEERGITTDVTKLVERKCLLSLDNSCFFELY